MLFTVDLFELVSLAASLVLAAILAVWFAVGRLVDRLRRR